MSTENTANGGAPEAANAKRLLWAGFMAILAAGVGFAIRGGIFDNWGKEFGFTGAQLGSIGGAGLSGFCFGIIIGGVICDKIGYGKLIVVAFALHVLSAFVTFGARGGISPDTAYSFLTGACSSSPSPTARSKPSPIRSWPHSSRTIARIT